MKLDGGGVGEAAKYHSDCDSPVRSYTILHMHTATNTHLRLFHVNMDLVAQMGGR